MFFFVFVSLLLKTQDKTVTSRLGVGGPVIIDG